MSYKDKIEGLKKQEADILKSMYEDSAKHIEKTAELFKRFERQQEWVFESFDARITAIETKLSDLIPKVKKELNAREYMEELISNTPFPPK